MSRLETLRAFVGFVIELWQNRQVVAEYLERMWLARKGALEIAKLSTLDKPLEGFRETDYDCRGYFAGGRQPHTYSRHWGRG